MSKIFTHKTEWKHMAINSKVSCLIGIPKFSEQPTSFSEVLKPSKSLWDLNVPTNLIVNSAFCTVHGQTSLTWNMTIIQVCTSLTGSPFYLRIFLILCSAQMFDHMPRITRSMKQSVFFSSDSGPASQ